MPDLKQENVLTPKLDCGSPESDSSMSKNPPLRDPSPLGGDETLSYSDFWSSSSSPMYSPYSPLEPSDKPNEFRNYLEGIVNRMGPDALLSTDINGYSAIHVAAFLADAQTIKYLLSWFQTDPVKRRNFVNKKDFSGDTPLCHLANSHAPAPCVVEAVTCLMENGADQSIANHERETPLHIAAKMGSTALAIFLQYKPKLDVRDAKGNTALMNACVANQMEAAHRLLIAGADINLGDYDGTAPILAVTKLGLNRIACFLIDHKASLDVADCSGNNAIHWSAVTNNEEILKELFKRGRKISSKNDPNSRKETPIFLAIREGHKECVRLLLEQNVDLCTVDQRGKTCLTLPQTPEIAAMIAAHQNKTKPEAHHSDGN